MQARGLTHLKPNSTHHKSDKQKSPMCQVRTYQSSFESEAIKVDDLMHQEATHHYLIRPTSECADPNKGAYERRKGNGYLMIVVQPHYSFGGLVAHGSNVQRGPTSPTIISCIVVEVRNSINQTWSKGIVTTSSNDVQAATIIMDLAAHKSNDFQLVT